MAQPPAWLRHQAVLASAVAMVSMTWKKVTGSVSSPFCERGNSRRNRRASCSASSSDAGNRRSRSMSTASEAIRGTNARARSTMSDCLSGGVTMRMSKRCLQRFGRSAQGDRDAALRPDFRRRIHRIPTRRFVSCRAAFPKVSPMSLTARCADLVRRSPRRFALSDGCEAARVECHDTFKRSAPWTHQPSPTPRPLR